MSLKAHHHPVKLMGCGFVLTAVDDKPQRAWDAIRLGVKEIERIEALISSWQDSSQTTRINEQAGIAPVQVSVELFDLIARSLKVSKITQGAFDISGTLSRYYWKFDQKEHPALPTEKIAELQSLINYELIELDRSRSTVFLKKQGMKIGFGAIGKGYAAYKAYQVMEQHGVKSGLINASGDLMCWGAPPDADQWEINIPHPDDRSLSLAQFKIPFGAVVTSGNYENFTLIDGRKLSHIIDPRTGMPVQAIKHVSVVSPNPEFADALATALSVMGVKAGLKLVNQLYGVECILIDEHDQIHYSNHLKSFALCVN